MVVFELYHTVSIITKIAKKDNNYTTQKIINFTLHFNTMIAKKKKDHTILLKRMGLIFLYIKFSFLL